MIFPKSRRKVVSILNFVKPRLYHRDFRFTGFCFWLLVGLLQFFVSFEPASIYAQNLNFSADSDYMRQLDALQWRQISNLSYSDSVWSLQFRNTFQTRFVVLNNNAANVQDENTGNMKLAYRMNEFISITSDVLSYRFFATNVEQDAFYSGIRVSPDPNLDLYASAGYMTDQRNERRDSGPAVLGTASYRFSRGEFFNAQPRALIDYANLSPRKQISTLLETPLWYNFESFSLAASVRAGRFRRDSYQPGNFLNRNARNVLESIETDTLEVDVLTRFPLSDQVSASIEWNGLTRIRNFNNQNLDGGNGDPLFDSRFSSLRSFLKFELEIPFKRHVIRPMLRLNASRDENNLINVRELPDDLINRRRELIANTNFTQQFIELGFRDQWNSDDVQFNAGALVNILRHDTPEVNFDDRDEQVVRAFAQSRIVISPFMNLTLELAGEQIRNSFLFEQRSAENNVRRSIRLIPGIFWTPNPRWRIWQNLAVRANYTVYDFNLPGQTVFDQSAREWSFKSTIEHDLPDRFIVRAEIQRAELHIGRLIWSDFREAPLDTLITYDIHLQGGRQYRNGRIMAGFRVFVKRDFQPLAQASAEELVDGAAITRTFRGPGNLNTIQWGPTFDVNFPMVFEHQLIIRGWYQIQNLRQQIYTSVPEDQQSVYERAIRNFPSRSFPNLEIMARLRF